MNNRVMHNVCMSVCSFSPYLLALALSVSSSSASSSSHDSKSTVTNKQQNNKHTNSLDYQAWQLIYYILSLSLTLTNTWCCSYFHHMHSLNSFSGVVSRGLSGALLSRMCVIFLCLRVLLEERPADVFFQ